MKKWTAIILALLLVLAAIAGCQPEETKPTDPVVPTGTESVQTNAPVETTPDETDAPKEMCIRDRRRTGHFGLHNENTVRTNAGHDRQHKHENSHASNQMCKGAPEPVSYTHLSSPRQMKLFRVKTQSGNQSGGESKTIRSPRV